MRRLREVILEGEEIEERGGVISEGDKIEGVILGEILPKGQLWGPKAPPGLEASVPPAGPRRATKRLKLIVSKQMLFCSVTYSDCKSTIFSYVGTFSDASKQILF